MSLVAVLLSVVLAIACYASGAMKFLAAALSSQMRDQLRIDTRVWWSIGALEVLVGDGLLAGLIAPVVGVAAALGLALLMAGAVVVHGRVSDVGHAAPAALLLVVAILIATVRVILMAGAT